MTKTLSRKSDTGTFFGAGCLALFGLPFALAGAGVGIYICWIFADTLSIRSWEPVPVYIQSAELKTHRGDDSTTYSVSATYTYEVGGVSYTGDRVDISGGSDSMENYHRRIFAEIDMHRRSGTPHTGYYDPKNPSNAVLVREVRVLVTALLMLVPALFWPVGMVLAGGSIWGANSIRGENALKARFPGEPWRWRNDWKDGYSAVPASSSLLVYFLAAFPIMTLPTILAIFAYWQIEAGNYLEALFALPWLAIQIMAILWLLVLRGRLRRYGKRMLRFESIPLRAGDTMKATLQTEGPLPHRDPIDFEVTCVRKVTVKTNKKSSTRRSELWKKTWSVDAREVDRRGRGSAVPIEIRLGPGLPTGLDSRDNTEIEWKLNARCKTSGYDFTASFDLPVFGAVESPPEVEAEAPSVQAEPITFNDKVLQVQEVMGNGIEFHFYRGRFLSTTALLFLFVLIFGGATAAMAIKGGAPLFMIVLFGAVSFGMLLAAIQSLTGSIKTTLFYDELIVERVLLLRKSTRTIPREQIQDIVSKNGMTVNDRQYFDLYAVLTDKKQVKLGNHFPSQHEADGIAAMMRTGLALDS